MKKNETSCASMLNARHIKLVQENRHYMTAFWKAVRLCSLQGIGLRGHRENLGAIDSNPGNPLSILSLLSDHDSVIHDRLNGSTTAKYTPHSIQNELIEAASDMVCEEIVDEVSTANYFSLLCDETRDTSKVEQMSLILRYLRPLSQSIEIVESFVGFFPCDGLDAVSLRDYGFEHRFQGWDDWTMLLWRKRYERWLRRC